MPRGGEVRRPGTVMQDFGTEPEVGRGPLGEILDMYVRSRGQPGSGSGGGVPINGPSPTYPSGAPGGAPPPTAGSPGWAAMAQQYGPGIVGIITALMRRNGQGGSDGLVPPEVQQMLQEHMRRMQATGPLFDQLTTQAQAGLPRTS